MSAYPTQYDPALTLKHPEFKILPHDIVPAKDEGVNLACFYNEKQEIHLVQKPVPQARAGECIIHVRASGICGSDCHFWKHGHIGSMVVRNECGSGHESAGEVYQVGEGVTGFKVGDKVAIEAGVPCQSCAFCLGGQYNACPDVVFFSTPPYHGTLTRYHAHPAAWLHKLPQSVSFEEGALLEPLVVALAGIERSGLKLGDPLVICGAGPIGLVTLLAAQAAGATPIVITDLSESRLKFAKTLVPSVRTLVVNTKTSSEDFAKEIKALAGTPEGLNCAIECSGAESSIQAAIYSLRFGSTVLVIGLGRDHINLPFAHMSTNEIMLTGQFRYANQYPRAIRLVEAGLINLQPLVTHRFTLENAVAAFHTAVDPAKGAIKCQIIDASKKRAIVSRE